MEDASYGGSGAAKRRRDDPDEAPEAKRIRAADLILLDMLDDAEPADGDLASVMRSLEEEIAPFSSPQADRQPLEEFGEYGQVGGGDDDGGFVFDGGLFDYADAAPLAEFSWQAESLPAV